MSILKLYLILASILVMEVSFCFELLGIDTGQKGPLAWDIQFKRLENCKERGPKLIDFDLRLKRVSRTRVDMVGNITFKVDYGDNIKIISDFSTWGNGGWKSNAYRLTIKKACSEFSVLENFIIAIRKESRMPLTTCPIPKGTYELDNFDTRVINNISMPFYTIPTLWRMTFSHYDKTDNRLLDCKVFIIETKVKHLKRLHDQDNKKSKRLKDLY